MGIAIRHNYQKGLHVSFQRRLDLLIETVHPPWRGPYSLAEIADGTERDGFRVSVSYLSNLRRGKMANPSVSHVAALARFFGVSPEFFFESTHDTTPAHTSSVSTSSSSTLSESIEEEVKALENKDIRIIAMLSHGLSQQSLRALADLTEQFRRFEGLPDGNTENPETDYKNPS